MSPAEGSSTMSMTLGCLAFPSASLGMDTFRTPFSSCAFTASKFAAKGSRNCRQNLPTGLSAWCHLSPSASFPSSSFLLPLILSTLPSSTSTFMSSFVTPAIPIPKHISPSALPFYSSISWRKNHSSRFRKTKRR
ncbi:hypothetical protein EJ110_NYTH54340 [Nymphaea thermarum]|nr:hypothetical protein EJ110_NYTH54340 [Nymphaea thermarum]